MFDISNFLPKSPNGLDREVVISRPPTKETMVSALREFAQAVEDGKVQVLSVGMEQEITKEDFFRRELSIRYAEKRD